MRMTFTSTCPWLGAAAMSLVLGACFEDPSQPASSTSAETGDGDGDPGDGDGEPGDGDGDPGDGDGDPGDGDGDPGDGDGDLEPGAYRWHVTYPGYSAGIAAYGDRLLVAGTLNATWETPGATLVPELVDVLVMGLRDDGAIDWARSLGGSAREVAMDLVVYGDARFAVSVLYSDGASTFGGPVFPAPAANAFSGALLGLEGPGMHAWSIGLVGADVFPHRLDVNGSFQVVATGRFGEGPIELGDLSQTSTAGDQIFFARLDTNNDVPNPVILTQFGGVAGDEGRFTLYDGFGGIYLGGTFRDTMILGGQEYTATGGKDVFIARIDNIGQVSAVGVLMGPADVEVEDAVVDASGKLILAGSFAGTIGYRGQTVGEAPANRDGYVVELDGGLDLVESWTLPSPGNVAVRRVAIAPNGDLAVAGEATGGVDLGTGLLPLVGNLDGWVVRYDSARDPVWGELYGSIADDRVSAVGFAAQSRLVIGLSHLGQVTLPGGEVLENPSASHLTSIVAVH